MYNVFSFSRKINYIIYNKLFLLTKNFIFSYWYSSDSKIQLITLQERLVTFICVVLNCWNITRCYMVFFKYQAQSLQLNPSFTPNPSLVGDSVYFCQFNPVFGCFLNYKAFPFVCWYYLHSTIFEFTILLFKFLNEAKDILYTYMFISNYKSRICIKKFIPISSNYIDFLYSDTFIVVIKRISHTYFIFKIKALFYRILTIQLYNNKQTNIYICINGIFH